MTIDAVRRVRVDASSVLPPPSPPQAVADPAVDNRAAPSAQSTQSTQPAVGPAVTPSPDSANAPSVNGARPTSAAADATIRASSSRKAKSGKSGKHPKFHLSNKFMNNIRPDYKKATESTKGSTDNDADAGAVKAPDAAGVVESPEDAGAVKAPDDDVTDDVLSS